MTVKTFPHRVVATINESMGPVDRGARYEDPLDAVLKSAGLGEVTGGGTGLDGTRRIAFVDIEVALADLDGSLELLRQTLKKAGAPGGSVVSYPREGGVVSVSIESGAPVADSAKGSDALVRRLIGAAAPETPVQYDPAVVAKTAQKMLDNYRRLFVEAYQYGAIDPKAYDPEIFEWYDAVGVALERLGFDALGDLKIVKDAAKPEPGAGAFARRFLAGDRLTRVDIFQVKPPKGGPYTRVVNLVTEFDDGRFIYTSTAAERFNTPDCFVRQRVPDEASIDEMYGAHQAHVAAYRIGHPAAGPVALLTADHVMASENRSQAASAAYRRRQAAPTVEELVRLGSTPEFAALVHEEIGRILSAGAAAGRGDDGATPTAPSAGEWHVAAVELSRGGGVPMGLDELIRFCLDQGIAQVKKVGSPLNPFLVLDDGRAFFFVCTAGAADPMEIALGTLRAHGAQATCCALVIDSRITVRDGAQCDAIVVMASQRGDAQGQTWAQGYRPGNWLRSLKVLDLREQVATSKNLFHEARSPKL